MFLYVWLQPLLLVTPVSLFVALMPLQKARDQAVTEGRRRGYLTRIGFLLTWEVALVAAGVASALGSGAVALSALIFGPGLIFVIIRLVREREAFRLVVNRGATTR